MCRVCCRQLAVGMYFPSMGYLRSQVIPEEQRASIMNWFRVPMNLITCAGLLWLHQGEAAGGNQVRRPPDAAPSLLTGPVCRVR